MPPPLFILLDFMESLLAFIPEDRRLALQQGRELPDRTYGSALFADISGFTPLTAALAQELGVQRGAEELPNQINPVFEAIIAELHRFGGSVIGFAGDSITCWLDKCEGWRGVACALAMQHAMQAFSIVKTPAGTPIHLAIKVAVTAGPARRFVVGDPGVQRIDVLAGRTLDRMAAAEHLAQKGEVIVGEEVVASLGDALRVGEWREGPEGQRFAIIEKLLAHPDTSPYTYSEGEYLPEEQAQSWLLPPIYSRLKTGSKFLAELRPAVPLFLSFKGIDFDEDEEAGLKLDTFVRWIQSVLEKQDGFLIQLTMGDKGSYAYACFGAPLAHDDDGVRACNASWELLRPPENLNFVRDIQIGVSRGRVWVGAYGARDRHTYGVLGNEVNMAARLMGKARSGQILVRRRVAREAGTVFQFRDLGLMTVKGGAEPIPVAEITGRLQSHAVRDSHFNIPLVGREAELAQLERLLDKVLSGRGQVVVLEGPTGIGKSHLAHVLEEYAADSGFQVIQGFSQRIFQATAYYPWQQVMRRILDLKSDPSVQEFEEIERVLAQFNPDWRIRAPLLGDILGLVVPDNATTAAFDPKQRQGALFGLVGEIVHAWARGQPLLVVFENAHWLDEPSQALIESLAKQIHDAPVMLMLVARPASETGYQASVVHGLQTLENYQAIHLGELDSEGVEALIAELLGSRASPLAQKLITAKSQGNPFFTRELIDSLNESGHLVEAGSEWILSDTLFTALQKANVLTPSAGAWVLADVADLSTISLGIPDSIQGVILARLDRLPDSHKPTIKVASVVGYGFDLGLVSQIHPAHPPADVLRHQADTLVERDFIVDAWKSEADAPPGYYNFRQQAIQEVSYETLLFNQRRELHCNLAELLEQQMPEAIDQIAYHAYYGEDWARSLHYHLLAGLQDKKLFANLQSIEHFRKALYSAERLPGEETQKQRREIHAGLGELLLTIGQHDEASEHLGAALALAHEDGDAEAEAYICRWIARSHEVRGQYQPALEWIDRGLALLGDQLTPSSVELRLIRGLILTRQGNYKRAREQALACLLVAEQLQNPSIIARSHNLLGNIDRSQGRIQNSITYVEESLKIYREIGDLQGQAIAQNSLGNSHFDLGQWAEADSYYRQAGQTLSQLGNIYNRLFVDNNLGGIALNQGRLDDALLYYRRALNTLAVIGGSLWVTGVLHLNLGATHARRQELPAAFEHLEESRELFERAKNRDLLPELHRRFAEAYLADGNLTQAREEGQKALAVAGELAVINEVGLAWRIIGEIDAAEGNEAGAEASFLKAVELLQTVDDRYGLACARLSLAAHYHRAGQYEQRDELIGECRPIFEQLGATLEIERLQELLA
jgi:class 3 adenylate cyclase/tetratricopeptide (TPR) repeat protein